MLLDSSDGPGMVEMGHVAVFGSNFHHPRPTCVALVFLDVLPHSPQTNKITLRWTTCGAHPRMPSQLTTRGKHLSSSPARLLTSELRFPCSLGASPLRSHPGQRPRHRSTAPPCRPPRRPRSLRASPRSRKTAFTRRSASAMTRARWRDTLDAFCTLDDFLVPGTSRGSPMVHARTPSGPSLLHPRAGPHGVRAPRRTSRSAHRARQAWKATRAMV